MTNEERLLEMVQRTYRKHHLGDESIGWEELSLELCNVLCEVMGDKAFVKWVNDTCHSLHMEKP